MSPTSSASGAEKKRGRPPSDRVRWDTRITLELLDKLHAAAEEDKRQPPDELDYLLVLGLRMRDRVRKSEKKALEDFG